MLMSVEIMLNAAIVFASLMPDIPEEGQALIGNLLGNLNISVSGSCLDIILEMTMSEFEALMQGLFSISSNEMEMGTTGYSIRH